MISVLMLDLGGTLVSGTPLAPFPGVLQALADIQQLALPSGKPLRYCLVSDFKPLASPATPAQVAILEQEYLTILQSTGLDQVFHPFEIKVTLSTHVGVSKPDCRVFQVALNRLGNDKIPLHECLFITEDATHIAKVQSFGMKTLRFGTAGTNGIDFSSWSEAKDLIAALL